MVRFMWIPVALKRFADLMLNNPDWRAIFAPEGRLLQEGELIRRANLSRTLATIAQEGADAFYHVGVNFLLLHSTTLTAGLRDRLRMP